MQRRPRAAAVRGKKSTPTPSNISPLEPEKDECIEERTKSPVVNDASTPVGPNCAISEPSTSNTEIYTSPSIADSEGLRTSSDKSEPLSDPSLQRRPRAGAFRAGKNAPLSAFTSPNVPLEPSKSSIGTPSSDAVEMPTISSNTEIGTSSFASDSGVAGAVSNAALPAKEPSMQRRPRAVAVRAGKKASQPAPSSPNAPLKPSDSPENASPGATDDPALLARNTASSAPEVVRGTNQIVSHTEEKDKQSEMNPISSTDATTDLKVDDALNITLPVSSSELLHPAQDNAATLVKAEDISAQTQLDSTSLSLEDDEIADAMAHAEMAQYATILGATSAFEHNYGVDGIENAEGSFVGDGDDEEDGVEDPLVNLLSGGYSIGYDSMRKHQSKQVSSEESYTLKNDQQALLDGVAGPIGTTSNAAQHAGTAAALPSYSGSRHREPVPQQTQRPSARLSPPLLPEDVDSANCPRISSASHLGEAAAMNTAKLRDAEAVEVESIVENDTGYVSEGLLTEDVVIIDNWPTEPAELATHFAAVLGEGVNALAALVEPDGDTSEMGVGIKEVTLVLATSSSGNSDVGVEGGSERNTGEAAVTQQLVVYDAASVEEYYIQVEAKAAEANDNRDVADADENNEVEHPAVLYAVDLEEVLFVLEGHQTPALEAFRMLCVDGTYSDDGSSCELLFSPDRCCSLVGLDFSLDLICADASERSALVAGLAALLGFQGDESKKSSGGGDSVGHNQGRILSKMTPNSGADGNGAASALVGVVLEGLRAALGLSGLQDSANDNNGNATKSPGRNGRSRKRNVNNGMNDDDATGGGGGNSDDGTASTVSGATSVASSKAEARRQRLLRAAGAASSSTKIVNNGNGFQHGYLSTTSPRAKSDAFSDDGDGDGVASTVSAATSIVSADAMAQRQRLANAANAFTFAKSYNNPSSSALTMTARATPNSGEEGTSLAEDAIGSLVQQLEAATVEGSDSENGSGMRKFRAQSSGLGSSVQFLRAAGPMDGPDGGETVCRRCNGDEPLGSGLFMRCEGCFDWFHPECVSALRRMQVETLLALQRWICRRCYQRSKRYRDLKTFQRSEKSSHRSGGGGGGGRSRGSRGRSSKGAGGDDGSSSSSSSGSESSGGGQAARALAARKRPQLSLGAELTKLLPDAPTASGLGKPRFIRWAHKCSDHACQIGQNEKLIGDAVRNYCVECRVPDDSAPGGSDGNKKGRNLVEAGAVDWSGVALDALAALYYAPAATTKLLASRAVQSIVIKPGQKFVATWLPALLSPDTAQAFLDPTHNKGIHNRAKSAGRSSSAGSNSNDSSRGTSSRSGKKSGGKSKRRQRRRHEGSDGDEIDDGEDGDRSTSVYSASTGTTTNTTSTTANSSVDASTRATAENAARNGVNQGKRGMDRVNSSSSGGGGGGAFSALSSLPRTLADGATSFFTNGLPFLASDRNNSNNQSNNSSDKSNHKSINNRSRSSANRNGSNLNSEGSEGGDDNDDDHGSVAVSAKDSAKVSARAARAAAMAQGPGAVAADAASKPTAAAAAATAPTSSHLGSASDYTETSDYDSSSVANPSTLPPRTASRVRNRRPPAGRATMSSAPPLLSKSGPTTSG